MLISHTMQEPLLTTVSILRFLYQTLCSFLQIKDRKHIEQNVHSVAVVMP